MAESPVSPEAALPVRPGEVFAGKYRIESVLGVGGMGVVAAAMHLELGQRVAVKFLLPELAANPEGAVRFSREARAAVQLTSEHAVRVHDVGQLESGAPYMVMEFLDGHDLGVVLEKDGPLDVVRIIEYVLQAIDALAEAHSAGIVHRDLKPSNLFLARRGRAQRIKVLDFGISKHTVEAQSFGLTGTSAILGSPYYMAPEQMRSTRTVDHRADIWSLGVIMYELSTGRLPFQGTTLTELCLMIAQDTPEALRTVRADLPAGLESIVKRCLEKDPAARFGSVAELGEALEALGASLGLHTVGASSGPILSRAPASMGSTSAAMPASSSSASSLVASASASASKSPHMHTAAAVTLGNAGSPLPTRRPTSHLTRALIAGGVVALVVGVAAFRVRGAGHATPQETAPPVAATAPSAAPSVAIAPVPRESSPRPSDSAVTTGLPTEASAVAVAPSASVPPAPHGRASAVPRPLAPRASALAPASAKTPTPPANSGSTFSHDRQ